MVSKELQQIKQNDLSVITPANLPQITQNLTQISGNNLSTITTNFPDKRTSQQVSPFSDYNDSNTINSIADILWNTLPGNPHKTKNETFEFLNNSIIRDIPGINLIGTSLDIVDHVYRHTVIPIQQGQPTALLTNAMQDLTESLDILANPIKGAVIETTKQGPIGIIKGLYKGSVGRVNYDYDTGSTIANFVLEVISDPFNWISFGAASGLKTLGTASADALQEAAELTVKQGGKILKQTLPDAIKEIGEKDLKKTLKTVTADILNDYATKGIDLTTGLKQYGAGLFTEEFMQNAVDIQLKNLNKLDSTSFFIKKGLIGVARTTEKVESYLFRAAAWSSFIPTPYLMKHLMKATPIANTLDVLADHVYKSAQIVTGVEDPMHVKYIEHTLNNKERIQTAFNEFQEIIKIEDKISNIDVENAFRDVSMNKLLHLRNTLKESEDLTVRDNLYKVLLNIIPSDEGKAFRKFLNNEQSLIQALNKANYTGDTIYDCIKSAFNNNLVIIEQFNKKYDNMFNDVYNNYKRHQQLLFSILDEAQMLEQSKQLVKEITEQDPGIQQYILKQHIEYTQNIAQYNAVLTEYPNFLYQFKKEQDTVYFRLKKDIIDKQKQAAVILQEDKTYLTKVIQEHQDAVLRLIKQNKYHINTDVITEYCAALKNLVVTNTDRNLTQIINLLDDTYKSFTNVYQKAIQVKDAQELAKVVLNKNLQQIAADLPKYRTAKRSVDKVITTTAATLKNATELKKVDPETWVTNYIKTFKQSVEDILYTDIHFLDFDVETILNRHINKVQSIYDTEDLDKLIPALKIELHQFLNDLTYLSNKIDTFIDKTVPDLINHFSGANGLKTAVDKLHTATQNKTILKTQTLDKVLKADRVNSKIFSDLTELSKKDLTMTTEGNAIASVRDLAKLDLDIVDERDIDNFLTTLFEFKETDGKSINEDLMFILNNLHESFDDANYFLEDLEFIIASFTEYHSLIKTGKILTQSDKMDIISNIELLKQKLYFITEMSKKSESEISVIKLKGTQIDTSSAKSTDTMSSEELATLRQKYLDNNLAWYPTDSVVSVNKAITSLINKLNDLNNPATLINDYESVVLDYINYFNEFIKTNIPNNKLLNNFGATKLIANHLTDIQKIYDEADLKDLINLTKIKMQELINELQTLSDNVKNFLNSANVKHISELSPEELEILPEPTFVFTKFVPATATNKNTARKELAHAIKNASQNCLDFIDKYKAGRSRQKLIHLAAGDNLYITATNKTVTIKEAFLDETGVKALVHDLYDVDGIHSKSFKAIQRLAEAQNDIPLSQAYKSVTDFFDRFQAVEDFIASLYLDDTFTKDTANRLFDSLAKYDDISISEFIKNLDYHVDRIINNAEIGRQATERTKEMSIDALVKNLYADIKKGNFANKQMQYTWESFTEAEKSFFKKIGELGETHNAFDDIEVTELYLRLTNNDHDYFHSVLYNADDTAGTTFINSNGGKVRLMDFETTGKQTGSSWITECAMKIAGNNSEDLNLRLEYSDDWYPVPKSVIQTKFPNLPEDIAEQKYIEYHTKAFNKDTNITWVNLEQMAELIVNYFKRIDVNDSIVGHNINNYDLKVMQSFLDNVNIKYNTHYYLPANPTSYTFIDSYQDMLNKEVPTLFTPQIKSAFKQHLANMVGLLDPETSSAKLFKAISSEESKAIIELNKLITNSIDPSKRYQFTDIMNSLKTLAGKVNDFIKTRTGAEYKESQLMFTKSITQTEEGRLLYKTNLKQASEELQELLKDNTLTKAAREEIIEKLELNKRLLLAAESTDNPYINIQMLMNSYNVSDSIISYYNIGRTDVINDFFKFDDFIKQYPEGVTSQLINNLNDIAKTMDNIVGSLRRITKIYDNKDLIQKALTAAHQLMLKQNRIYFDFLRTENDARYMFAELVYIYNKFTKDSNLFIKALEDTLGTEQTNQVMNLLEHGLKPFQGDWKETKLIDDKIDYYLTKTINSPEVAVKNYMARKDAWNQLIDKDLRKFTTVENAPGIVTARTNMIASQAEPTEQFLNMFSSRLQNATPNIQRSYMQSLLDCTSKINIVKLNQILDLNPEDLLNVLCFQSTFIGFDVSFVNKYDANIIEKLIAKKDEWLKYGIEFDFNKTTGEVYIFPNESVSFKCYLNSDTDTVKYQIKDITTQQFKDVELYKLEDVHFGKLFEESLNDNEIVDAELVEQLFKMQQSINRVSNYEATGTTYEIVNKSFFESLPKLLPNSVIKKMCKSDFTNDYLFKDRPRFNMTFLGSHAFKRKFSSYASSDIVASMMNTFSSTVKNATERFHYLEFALSSGYDLNLLAEKCQNLGELRKTLENNPNFVLGVIMKNDKGIEIARRLKLNTEVDFQRAVQFGAKIYDEHIFTKIESVINAKSWNDSNPFLNLYSKVIRIYKQGYLFSTGFFVRNVIDTFMRNISLAQGDIPEAAKQTYKAIKLYMAYNETVKQLTDAVVSRSGILDTTTINYLFKYQPEKFTLSKDEFDFAHSLLNEGAFMGEVRSWRDYKAFKKEIKDSPLAFENKKEYAEAYDLYMSQQNYKRFFGTFNEDIENIQRLAGYLTLQNKGIPFTKAIYDLKATHFDYGHKTELEKMMELIIPFYTFKVKNLHYWLDSLEKYGWLSNVMMDFMTPIWNFDEYDQYELERNRSLQYNIKTGNVMFDNGLTFKLNPSMMDAFQLVTDPVGSIGSSMFVGVQLMTDLTGNLALKNAGTKTKEFMQSYLNVNMYNQMNPKDILQYHLNLLPYGAAVTRLINGVQYAQDINNPLPALVPSLFGRVKRFKPYTPESYSKRSNYSKYKKIAKPKKSYTKKRYNRYTPDYYPINFKNIYINGMYSIPNISTYTAQANRYYHFSRLLKLPRSNIYNKLYTSKGKSRWDAMLQPVNSQNLKYVIKNTIHYR